MTTPTVAFVAANTEEAVKACRSLESNYSHVPASEAEVIVAIGGDGFMLETLHQFMNRDVPIFGLNQGSVGFLMNEFNGENLICRVAASEEVIIHPLRMIVETVLALKSMQLRSTRFLYFAKLIKLQRFESPLIVWFD